MIRGTLAANTDVLVGLDAGAYRHAENRFDRIVPFVKKVGNDAGVPVKTQHKLGHVIGTDGHPIEVLEILVVSRRPERLGRYSVVRVSN